MFRIERTTRRKWVQLSLEGKLKSEHVETAESVCLEALANSDRVMVLLKNVTEIDTDGYAFLKRLMMTKARVRATGIFSRYVLHAIRIGRR
jgi:ABC-type transporter Mla MlaB component